MANVPKLANQIPTWLLRSPLHPILSSRYLLFEFTGRTSGAMFRTPLAYVRDDDQILLSTDSPWWRNLASPARVRLWLQGRRVDGTAEAMSDPRASARAIRRLVDAIPSYARPAGLAKDDQGRVTDDEIARVVAAGRVGITVDLEMQR